MIESKSNYDTDPFQAFSSIKCLPGIGSIAVQKVLLQLPPLQRILPTLTLSSRQVIFLSEVILFNILYNKKKPYKVFIYSNCMILRKEVVTYECDWIWGCYFSYIVILFIRISYIRKYNGLPRYNTEPKQQERGRDNLLMMHTQLHT